MQEQARIILTGSGGRVGRAISTTFAGSPWEVLPYSHGQRPEIGLLEDLLTNAEFPPAQAIIHTAWSTVPYTAQQAEEEALKVDLTLVSRLLRRVEQLSAPPLLVFLSTGAVYGPANGRTCHENTPLAPISRYAQMKMEAEQLIRESEVPHAILRISNLYGIASKADDPQGVIGKLVHCAEEGKPFTQWGQDSVKDYLHCDDFLSALSKVLDNRLEGTWNIASGQATRLTDIIAMVRTATGKPLVVKTEPAASWDVAESRLDATAFMKETGWKPLIDLEEGIRREVAAIRREI